MNNKNILTVTLTALAIVSAGQIALARDEDQQNNHPAYQEHNQHRGDDGRDWNNDDHDRGPRLESEIRHVNRMLSHVEREMKRYGANWRLRRDYQDVRGDVRRLNNQYQNGDFDRRRLRAKIEHIRNDLHRIEKELRVRASEWYQWR